MKWFSALALPFALLLPAPLASQASPPSEAAGRLNLVSQPGVEVIWENVSLGTTDPAGLLVIEGIPPGSYGLLLRKTGYRDRTSQVDVVSGAQSIRIQLRHTPAPTPTPDARPRPVQPREPRPERDPSGFLASLEMTSGDQAATQPEPPASQTAADAAPTTRAVADAASETEQPEPQGSDLPPMVYLLGLALLGTSGALVLQWRRRARARSASLAESAPYVIEPPKEFGAGVPSFLGDLKRREVAIENMLDAGAGSGTAQPGPIEVEVIDLGPVEDDG